MLKAHVRNDPQLISTFLRLCPNLKVFETICEFWKLEEWSYLSPKIQTAWFWDVDTKLLDLLVDKCLVFRGFEFYLKHGEDVSLVSILSLLHSPFNLQLESIYIDGLTSRVKTQPSDVSSFYDELKAPKFEKLIRLVLFNVSFTEACFLSPFLDLCPNLQ